MLTRLRKKTKAMLRAEKRVGMPVDDFLIAYIPELGYIECAKRLGVASSTVKYWMFVFRLQTHTVILRPGQEIIVSTPIEDTEYHMPVLQGRIKKGVQA